MSIQVQIILIVSASLLTGALIVRLTMRSKVRKAFESGLAETRPEMERLSGILQEKENALQLKDKQIVELGEDIHQIREERGILAKDLAVAEQANKAIPELKSELARYVMEERGLRRELQELSASLAQEKGRSAQLNAATARLCEQREVIDKLREQLSGRDSEIRELRTRMEEEHKRADEKLALLNEARAQLTNQFRVLAQEILDEKGKVFSEQSRSGLKTLLDPLRDQLTEFKQNVNSLYIEEGKERAALQQEIKTLRDLNQQISQDAVNLARALRGDKKAQGSWGEMILEKVLERSGLRKDVEYETQGSFRDTQGRLLRPDVLVHLPESRDIVIDSKVSLIAYERYVSAEEEREQKAALAQHVQAVKAHIDELHAKDYAMVKGIRSLDFVLLFMPIEAAFVAAFKEDENLFSHAFERRIVVVTPTTLLATLKTIENIWRYERQNRNARSIVTRASAIYEKLRLFVESMEKLGRQIEIAHNAYDEAMNRLVRGKGNVISQASRFSDLGVAVKRELPRTITEIADMENNPEYETLEK